MASHTMVHVVFHPKWGPDFQMVFHIKGIVLDPTDSNLQAVISAINSVTRAVAIEISLSVIHENTGSPTSAAIYVNEDKMRLKGLDEEGNPHNWQLPSLDDSLLDDNQETIDIAVPPASDLVAAITTYARSPGGTNVTTVTNAYRTENRKRLKSGVRI